MTSTPATSAPKTTFDVVVIGAGLVGSAIARKFSGYQLSVALLDARDDVNEGTSKANTAILHTGFDAKPGTLESRMVHQGYHLLSDYAKATGIPVEPVGAILVAWDAEQLAALPSLQDKAEKNGYPHTEIIDADEVYRDLPHLGPGALGGLTVPGESIICMWTTNFALATDAVQRGATLLLGRRVNSITRTDDNTILHTSIDDVAAAGWSTRPAWVATRSTSSSATTASTSPPAAENCSSLTNTPAPSRTKSSSPSPQRSARAC